MKIKNRKTYVLFTGWVILLIAPFLGSCATDEKFAYTYDQINAANKKIASLEETVDETIDKKLGIINSNQASLRIEIDQLKEDISSLSGRVEETEYLVRHSLEEGFATQDSVLTDLTSLYSRVNKLETSSNQIQQYLGIEVAPQESAPQENQPAEAGSEETPSAQDSGEQTLYDLSLAQFNEGKYNEAMDGFKGFLDLYPKSDLADNAQFWIGECYMSLKEYKQAILAFDVVIKKYPKGNKVPSAMLREGIGWLEFGDKDSCTIILKDLIKKYPKSTEAQVAQKKLDTMK